MGLDSESLMLLLVAQTCGLVGLGGEGLENQTVIQKKKLKSEGEKNVRDSAKRKKMNQIRRKG